MSSFNLNLLSFILITSLFSFSSSKERVMVYDNQEVKTTFSVDQKFLGKYTGTKGGFLQLNEDGTGEYLYDYHIAGNQGCNKKPIKIEWGFVLSYEGDVLYFDREYGVSYPVIYKAVGDNSFQGCSKDMLVDYILVYDKDQHLSVSSSSDWKK